MQLDVLSDTTWLTLINVSRNMGISSGKFLYLEASTWDGVHIDAYRKFGIIQAPINTGQFPEVHFKPGDIVNIPGQSVVNFRISMPEDLVNYSTDCYISFNGMNKGSDLHLDYVLSNNSGTFQIPVFNGLDYKFKIVSSYLNIPSVSDAVGTTWGYSYHGEDVTLTHDIPIELVMPSNDQKNITDATNFQISDPGQKGVYFYHFILGIHSLTIITDKTSIRFSDVKSRLADFEPNTEYFWYVLKYPKYTSIDDFVSVKYTEDNRYNSIPCSQSFLFTTAP